MALVKKAFFLIIELFGVNKLFRHLNKSKVIVLLYHNIGLPRTEFKNAISEESFEKQLLYLKKHFNILSLDKDGEWVGFSDENMNIAISFDDGFSNNSEYAAPILKKHSVKATFFLIADCLENGEAPRFAKPDQKTINVSQAKELMLEGHHIACHSLSHYDYSHMSTELALADALEAKAKMEDLLGYEMTNFAFPWGLHTKDQVEELGGYFKKLFITDHGLNAINSKCYYRQEVDNNYQMYAAASGSLFRLKNII